MRFTELPLSAQTAYAELFEQTRAFEVTNALAGLTGSFQKLTRKGQHYWYFAYRDLDRKVRMACVGPNDARVLALVERFERIRQDKPLSPQAQAALQAASLATYFAHAGQAGTFNAAWHDALARGRGWQARAVRGKAALLRLAPELDVPDLWK